MPTDRETERFSAQAIRRDVRAMTNRIGLAATAFALVATAVISFAAPI